MMKKPHNAINDDFDEDEYDQLDDSDEDYDYTSASHPRSRSTNSLGDDKHVKAYIKSNYYLKEVRNE